MCPGDCSVCAGYLNPSPNEVSQTWDPNGCQLGSGSKMSPWDCCRHSDTESVAVVLQTISNEDLHRKDSRGRSAIDYAIDGNINTVRLLIDVPGFDLNAPCFNDGLIPLMSKVID